MNKKFNLNEFLDFFQISDHQRKLFEDFKLVSVKYYTNQKKLSLEISNKNILPYRYLEFLKDYLIKNLQLSDTEINISVKTYDNNIDIVELNNYVSKYCLLINKKVSYVSGGEGLYYLNFDHQETLNDFKGNFSGLRQFLLNYGIEINLELKMIDTVDHSDEDIIVKAVETKEENTQEKSSSWKKTNKKQTNTTLIADLEEGNDFATYRIEVELFSIENRENTKNNNIIQTLYGKDDSGAICLKRFEGKNFDRLELLSAKEGDIYLFVGNYRLDNYSKEYNFVISSGEKLDKPKPKLSDNALIKRVELDTHSNRSDNDGVCNCADLVQAAFDMGHKAMAITDHLNCQAFPIAQRKVNELLKKHPDRQFKMIYGSQFNMVEDQALVIRNAIDLALDQAEYVIFDLETTGLSHYYDHIIEFGATVYDFKDEQSYDFFIKPPFEISDFIQSKTHITNADLEKGKDIKEALIKIKEIFKDRVLVAHNASFDFGFLNQHLIFNGFEPLNNPVIDTLALAKVIVDNLRSYRLGSLAKKFKIFYDEKEAHRADFDANVLLKLFKLLLEVLKEKGITNLLDLAKLNDLHDPLGSKAYAKTFASYCNCLVKNKQGLKDLFELVSIAHTKELATFPKTTKKDDQETNPLAEARIFKSSLEKYRSNLLLGSSTVFGSVIDAALYRGDKDLKNAIAFYDYIELQPISQYHYLVQTYKLRDFEIVKDAYLRIIKEAKRQNKLIVATGDVHYVFLSQKIHREVFINSQTIGGAYHPLYIFDENIRRNSSTPTQRFLNTEEMLEEFSFLNDEALIKEIVIENPNKIVDMIEVVKPIHDGLYTPKIENSDQLLTDVVYQKAHKLYGPNLDPLIKERIERELNAVINNGYGVIYYVSHLLVKKSNEDGYLVGSRGSVGSSFIATMAGITEVNPLPVHYRCPHCYYLEWNNTVDSGYDLEDKKCPKCQNDLIGDGQNIPFETFLGFNADKIPDIDLNFSSEYQEKAHLFTREVFGEDHVFRAGTISTAAEKIAENLVEKYFNKINEKANRAKIKMVAKGCVDVKRTTGQHPGGIIVIPDDMSVYDFTPIQYPANNADALWKTTHFDFHEIHDNVLKFDILGHVDPTAMRLLHTITDIDPVTVSLNDQKVLKLFSSTESLDLKIKDYDEITGACGLPEFGTEITRGVLSITKPKTVSELIQISGLTHGTGVWKGNAQDLIVKENIPLKDVIGCRDDIMTTLIKYGLEYKMAFDIMESVRKGKGLKPEFEDAMKQNKVPEWYINSCKKINYMFPKAHAVAYVIMALRVAWYKIHKPVHYYISYFTLRADAYEIKTMIKKPFEIKLRLDELREKKNIKFGEQKASKKEIDIFECLEMCYEMVCRGYRFTNIDLNRSLAKKFIINPDNPNEIIPPFMVLDGLGEAVAQSIVDARNQYSFSSIEDFMKRTLISKTLKGVLKDLGIFKDLSESDQMQLF